MSDGMRLLRLMAAVLCMMLAIVPVKAAAQSGRIVGRVTSEGSGESLPGATVMVRGTSIGAATDLDGEYSINRAPAGQITLVISYLSFMTEEYEITLREGETIRVDAALAPMVIEGEEVVVTAQAQGQAAAINQQLASNTIIDVVSAERIQELPDANAAESIGRLPGISLERSGGEGQKVVIRGLAPQYNLVTINGVAAPATDPENRSIDLSMISPEMLGAIEVMKALTPDKDADALGGSVNLSIREAPPGLRSNLSFQSGYASQAEEFGVYKGGFLVSNRYFSDRLGAMLTGSIERANRASDQLNVSYDALGNPRPGFNYVTPRIANQGHIDNLDTRMRYGSSLILDYRIPGGSIRSNNFVSWLDRNRIQRRRTYSLGTNRVDYELRDTDFETGMFSTQLQGEHRLGGIDVDWGGAWQASRNEQPFNSRFRFRELGAFSALIDSLGPDMMVTGAKHALDGTFLYEGRLESNVTRESEYSAFADVSIPYGFGTRFTGILQFGTKFRGKRRAHENDAESGRFDSASWASRFVSEHEGFRVLPSNGWLAMEDWLDPSYDAGEFLNGRFENVELGYIIDHEKLASHFDYLRGRYEPRYDTYLDNYEAREDVAAGYVMTELHIGRRVMLLPGFRYEYSSIWYKGFNGSEPDEDATPAEVELNIRDTTDTANIGHFLPMVHLRIRPAPWFDVRLAYTNTLSRPNYQDLTPRRTINHTNGAVKYGNIALRPARAQNYDIFLSFYGNRLGLLTLGGFYKQIRDFSYVREAVILAGTALSPDSLGLPSSTRGYTITTPFNNSFDATLKGLEVGWQTRFQYLPTPFDGVVLNANYAYMDSDTRYPRTEVRRTSSGLALVDTAYANTFVRQPRHIANVSVGYDRGGFSGRVSFSYQGNVLTQPGRRDEEAAGEDAFYRWDLMLSQKVAHGLSVFFNMNNITNQPDESLNLLTGHPTQLEYYGYTANLGLRYTH